MKILALVCFLSLILSGCVRTIHIERDFSNLKKDVYERTDVVITRDMPTVLTLDQIAQREGASAELTRDDVVRIALANNPGLRADFEMLGVAKADLVQAGLYTNPTATSVFRFPTRDQGEGTAQTNIESSIYFRLSDFWQVPLSKKVSEDILEIVSLRILNSIVRLVADTKIAYDRCLALRETAKLSQELMACYADLRDEIEYRQLYGYTNDLDVLHADTRAKKAEILYGKYHVELQNAYIQLRNLMGFVPSSDSLKLTSLLKDPMPLRSCDELETYALHTRPDVLMAQVKMSRYKHERALEKSRMVKKVDLGISYNQDFDKPLRGIGPYLNIELPLFDSNYAQIARAEFFYSQAEEELHSTELHVQHEIRSRYALFRSEMEGADYHEQMIVPNYKRAADRAHVYAGMMQIPMTEALELKIEMIESEIELIEHQRRVRNEYTLLEKEVGTKLEQLSRNG